MRRLLALLALEAVAVAALALAGAGHRTAGDDDARRRLAGELALTDLALFSEASYCRHRSAGDRFTPFSDHPGAMEHFPAGSLVVPPRGGRAP